MAYASVADVKRVLGLTDTDDARDAAIRASLHAVESWLDTQGLKLTSRGPQVHTFYDVPEDATLHLPASDVVVTKVTVYPTPYWDSARDLVLGTVSPGYELIGNGVVVLRPSLWVEPFAGAYAMRTLRVHSKVDVHFVGTGVIPHAVTEGVAWLAAGHWKTGPDVLRDLKSEKIGDYTYTLGSGGGGDVGKDEPSFVTRARFFLDPFMVTSHVAVT